MTNDENVSKIDTYTLSLKNTREQYSQLNLKNKQGRNTFIKHIKKAGYI